MKMLFRLFWSLFSIIHSCCVRIKGYRREKKKLANTRSPTLIGESEQSISLSTLESCRFDVSTIIQSDISFIFFVVVVVVRILYLCRLFLSSHLIAVKHLPTRSSTNFLYCLLISFTPLFVSSLFFCAFFLLLNLLSFAYFSFFAEKQSTVTHLNTRQ